MKKNAVIILVFFLVSCNPFNENRVLNYQNQLDKLVLKLKKYQCGTYSEDDIDEFALDDFRELDIDFVMINSKCKNANYVGFFEENDSLIILTKKSVSIADPEKHIIYDFSKKPRNFGNAKIPLASYKITQLSKRWYYSETGFD